MQDKMDRIEKLEQKIQLFQDRLKACTYDFRIQKLFCITVELVFGIDLLMMGILPVVFLSTYLEAFIVGSIMMFFAYTVLVLPIISKVRAYYQTEKLDYYDQRALLETSIQALQTKQKQLERETTHQECKKEFWQHQDFFQTKNQQIKEKVKIYKRRNTKK